MTRDHLIKALFLMLLLASPCFSQQSEELRRKYGRAERVSPVQSKQLVERYTVRPRVTLTVKYSESGRACEMLIEPRRNSSKPADTTQVISSEEAQAVILELAPLSVRGRPIVRLMPSGAGCTSVVYNEYERVMIAAVMRCLQQGGGTYSVKILWKEAACEQPLRKTSA